MAPKRDSVKMNMAMLPATSSPPATGLPGFLARPLQLTSSPFTTMD